MILITRVPLNWGTVGFLFKFWCCWSHWPGGAATPGPGKFLEANSKRHWGPWRVCRWTGQKGHLCSEWVKSFIWRMTARLSAPSVERICGALEQGRWREIREDYPEQRKEVWNACYSYLLFFSSFSCLFLFLLVQNILGPCWRVGKWLCGLCGWWYRVVKFILFSSALFISYLETRDNARVRGEVSCPHATLTRNFTIQLHKKQALNAQKCNMILAGALSMYRADIWWRYSFSNTLSNPTPAVKPFNLQQGLNPPNCK